MLGYYFTNYGTNNITKNGCSNFNISQNFYLSVGRCCSNYAGGNIFPYEYRKWAKLKEIIFKKPQGFDVTNGSFRQYRTRGTGSSTNQFVSTIYPFSQTPNEVKYRTDSLYEDLGGSILISDDGFQGTFTASLTPNCKASNSTHNFIYGFVFERLGYLGSGLDTVMTTNTKDIVTFTKQDLNITVTCSPGTRSRPDPGDACGDWGCPRNNGKGARRSKDRRSGAGPRSANGCRRPRGW